MQEKNPKKAGNSFAVRDIIDRVDSQLIVMEAKVRKLSVVVIMFLLSSYLILNVILFISIHSTTKGICNS